MVGKVGDSQIIVNLPVTNVPKIIGNNAKTLGMKHLPFPYIRARGEPPDGACVVHGTDELLKQQDSISNGKTALSCLGEVPALPVCAALFLT
jgi:hypothetical protein